MSSESSYITQLEHRNSATAMTIWSLLNAAYQLEAQWLGIANFPPLSRTIQAIQESDSEFLGLFETDTLIAVLEFEHHGSWIKISSMAVAPDHHRAGHGRVLLTYLLGHYPDRIIEVETALKNQAAMGLYQNAGFNVISQYETADQLVKVLFRRTPVQAALY
jgi:ribosomal protein S18 acetylase RimI-like enzyme